MAYQMAATIVTLNDLERYSSVAGLFKCYPSNICAAFCTISTGSVLTRFLCISRASCQRWYSKRLKININIAQRYGKWQYECVNRPSIIYKLGGRCTELHIYYLGPEFARKSAFGYPIV